MISMLFRWKSVWKAVYTVQIQCRECWKLPKNCQHPLYILAEAIPRFIYSKFYHRANNCAKYADGFYNSKIDDKEGHIPAPLIMFTCTALRNALLEWQYNESVLSKASKSNLNADRPDHSNYFNYMNDGGKNASCSAAMGPMLLTLPRVVDTYAFLMNTWNTLLERYPTDGV